MTRRTLFSGALALPPVVAQQRDKRAGIYVIWYGREPNQEALLSQPYLKGGQIVLQWAGVEPERGKYDFSPIDKDLAEIRRKCTGGEITCGQCKKETAERVVVFLHDFKEKMDVAMDRIEV